MEDKILQTTYKLFTQIGIHQFTMDELAHQLRISKKTLYRFFPSRQDLVEQVCNQVAAIYEEKIEKATIENPESLPRLLGYIKSVVTFCKELNPTFFADLRRHYPVQWLELELKLENIIFRNIRQTLEKGISEGLFRGNLHPQLVINIWTQHLQADFEHASTLVNDYSKDEVFRQAMYLFLYGIISPQSIPALEKQLATISIPIDKHEVSAKTIPNTYQKKTA